MNSQSISFLENVSLTYSRSIHGWLSAVVCSFGIVFNVFNVIFLRKSKLASCSANKILISIAFCDSLIMAIYLPFVIQIYILYLNQNSLFWQIYSATSQLICSTFHAMSVWLTVYLSVYRYLYMKESVSSIQNSRKLRKQPNRLEKFILLNTSKIIISICLYCVLFCLPAYVYTALGFLTQLPSSNETTTILWDKQFAENKENHKILFEACFCLQAILGKIVPSFILAVFIAVITRFLFIIKQNKDSLRKGIIKVLDLNSKLAFFHLLIFIFPNFS